MQSHRLAHDDGGDNDRKHGLSQTSPFLLQLQKVFPQSDFISDGLTYRSVRLRYLFVHIDSTEKYRGHFPTARTSLSGEKKSKNKHVRHGNQFA